MERGHGGLVVADMLGDSPTVRKAGAFEGPDHADILAAMLGVCDLARADHGSDVGVAAAAESAHEPLVGMGIHHRPRAASPRGSSCAELGRGRDGWHHSSQVVGLGTTQHGVPRCGQGAQTRDPVRSDKAHNRRKGWRDSGADGRSGQVLKVVLLHVVEDSADELQAGSWGSSGRGSKPLQQRPEGDDRPAHMYRDGVVFSVKHVNDDGPTSLFKN